MTTTKDEQRPAPATDEDVQGLMGAIHQHHNLFGGECSHCAPIVASIRARIDQQRETIAALQARADKAEVDLRDHKTALNTLTDLYEEKAEELIKARAEVERLYGKVQGHGLVLAERDALRAQLAASDQNLKTMLQAAGEEAERQLAAAREEIAKLRGDRDGWEAAAVSARRSVQNHAMFHANAIGECRKINKAIHRVLRGRNNALKQLAVERAAREKAEKVIADLVEHHPKRSGWAEPPGHSHRIPGIWDDDNGDKNGTKCMWCATWHEARAILANRAKGEGR